MSSCCSGGHDHKDNDQGQANHQNYDHQHMVQKPQTKAVEYVCPMHPEEKSDKPGKCSKCGMDLEAKENSLASGHSGHMGHGSAKEFLKRFWVVTFLLIPLVLTSGPVLRFFDLTITFQKYIQFILSTAIFYYGLVFFQHASHEIKAKEYGMMTLVSVAVGAGYLFSAASTFLPQLDGQFYLEISSLIWVLLFGHYLEAKSSTAAGDALKEVAKLLPAEAHLIKGSDTVDVPVVDLQVNDVVLVKPGEKIPADAVVLKGQAAVDEAVITGESKPIDKQKGSQVVAGSICLDGSLEIKIERVGKNSTVGQIHALIAQAQMTKPKTQLLANRAAKWLTFSALTVAILTILIWSLVLGQPFTFALALAITVLVIACPHALGLAIPTVTTITTALATKNGLFIKDMGKLERIKDVDYVVMDKTGTLTYGIFGVSGIETFTDVSKDEIIKVAASLEAHSSHPIAASIIKFANCQKIKSVKPENFRNVSGKGVIGHVDGGKYIVGNKALMSENGLWDEEAEKLSDHFSKEGKTLVFVANTDSILGAVLLSDKIKPESKEAVADLHKLGVKVAMLTGDNQETAQAVASQLGLDAYFANVLPENKYQHVKSLQDKGHVVMMIGDGVNDAPALTQADVGVAIGAGTDIAVEAGDVVLTRSNPKDIVRLVILGRKTYRKMIENLVWAVGYNIVAIPAAAGIFAPFGFFLSPGVGAFLMSLSSVIVVINAFQLKKVKLAIE